MTLPHWRGDALAHKLLELMESRYGLVEKDPTAYHEANRVGVRFIVPATATSRATSTRHRVVGKYFITQNPKGGYWTSESRLLLLL
jgi:hypothetical protein